MSVDSFITRMRTRQAELFSSTVTVTRDGGPGTLDEATASYAAPTTTSIYAGAALVRPEAEAVAVTGATSVEVDEFLVKVPVNTAVEIGDTVTVTASDYDEALVGVGLRVLEVNPDEWQISRRLSCVRQTARPT